MKKLISNYREIQRGKTESSTNTNKPKFDVEKNLINQQSYGDRNILGKTSFTYIFKNGVSPNQMLYLSHELYYSHNLHLQEVISTDSTTQTMAREIHCWIELTENLVYHIVRRMLLAIAVYLSPRKVRSPYFLLLKITQVLSYLILKTKWWKGALAVHSRL